MTKSPNPPVIQLATNEGHAASSYSDITLRDVFAMFAPDPGRYPYREKYNAQGISVCGPGAEPETTRRYRYADEMLEERQAKS